MRLNRRAQALRPSPTMALDAKAKEAAARGASILNFGVGEPDFDTPVPVKAAAIAAIEEGFTKYTTGQGILPLRRAIVDKIARDVGVDYLPEEIVVTAGAKHALYDTFQLLLDDGDEVILLAPYWVSYLEQVRLAGGLPVVVSTGIDQGFMPSAAALAAAMTARTKAIIFNFPGNPSGVVPTKEQLASLLDVIAKTDAVIISDEIYEKLVYDGISAISPLALRPDLKERTVLVNGLSKSHAMTGWRFGCLAAPVELARAVTALQSQMTGSMNSITQKAALRALKGSDEDLKRMVAAFQNRRDLFVSGLRELPGFEVCVPQGAFYLFPRIRALLGRDIAGRRVQTSADFAELLLDRCGVAAVPGEAFGMPEHLRFSFACSEEQIRLGLERLRELLAS